MRPLANATVESLEGEVNSGTHHPEIIVGSIDEIPTEVANPTNVRSKANFQAAADSAKARAAASENVGRETRARDRVTQGQRSQHRPDYLVLVLDAVLKMPSLKSIKTSSNPCLLSTVQPSIPTPK